MTTDGAGMAQDAAQGVTSRGFGRPGGVPGWVGYALLPLLNLLAALVLSGLVILVIGENPLDVLALLVTEAVGYPEAIGYTLYYTTSYIFTGLAVAIAFHCGLFNIGGEGQAPSCLPQRPLPQPNPGRTSEGAVRRKNKAP
ncbi:hypothetical protein [Azospirillum brasilense]|uniref:hypothetical protein n=1 Tax=Azospirillum brasilense TaxID=192 RepID=UPI0031F2DEA5